MWCSGSTALHQSFVHIEFYLKETPELQVKHFFKRRILANSLNFDEDATEIEGKEEGTGRIG